MSAQGYGYEAFAGDSMATEYGEPRETSIGESEWDSPFTSTESEQPYSSEFGQEFGQEYGQEAYSYDPGARESEWESPFVTAGLASDTEIVPTPTEFPPTCGDTTWTRKPWKFGRTNPSNNGAATPVTTIPRAEVYEFALSQFDVDRHELKPEHKKAIADFTKTVAAAVSKYTGETMRVYTYGEASSTAKHIHNLELSHNRAFNTLHAIRCEFQSQGITYPVTYGFYPTGEVHARVRGPDRTENPAFRGVIVRAFAPLKECAKCIEPPGPQPTTTTSICVSVPRIAPRVANRLPPDIIPLGPVVNGLRLPIAIVTKAEATVRVDDRRSRQTGTYNFRGWGLEVALPAGRTRVDLQADLRASLDVLVRASASLGARLRLGPLRLALRIDVSAFAQLVVRLCAQLRARLEIDLGRPNIPELSQCRIIEARGVRGPAFPFPALSGPALLIVPGAGYGPAVLTLSGGGVATLGLTSNVIPVPADKSTVKTLLALGGSLQLAQAGLGREAEYGLSEAYQYETEWPEAFNELQP